MGRFDHARTARFRSRVFEHCVMNLRPHAVERNKIWSGHHNIDAREWISAVQGRNLRGLLGQVTRNEEKEGARDSTK